MITSRQEHDHITAGARSHHGSVSSSVSTSVTSSATSSVSSSVTSVVCNTLPNLPVASVEMPRSGQGEARLAGNQVCRGSQGSSTSSSVTSSATSSVTGSATSSVTSR